MTEESATALSSIVVALTTTIYTFGTFLLWWTTRKTLLITQAQLALTERAERAAILDELFRTHREIFLRLVPSDASLARFWDPRGRIVPHGETQRSDHQVAEEVFGSILINHAARIFQHYQSGLVDESVWEGTREDVFSLFGNPSIRERWEAVKSFHTEAFRNCIDAAMKERGTGG